jgi:hypothetical protein
MDFNLFLTAASWWNYPLLLIILFNALFFAGVSLSLPWQWYKTGKFKNGFKNFSSVFSWFFSLIIVITSYGFVAKLYIGSVCPDSSDYFSIVEHFQNSHNDVELCQYLEDNNKQ